MLAPKRKRVDDKTADADTLHPIGPAHITVVPEPPPAGPEPVGAPVRIAESESGSDGEEVTDKPKEAAAAKASPSDPFKPQQTAKKATNSREKASQTVPGAPRNVGVYLAPELLADVKEAVHLQRITYADLLLDAFDALDEDVIAREFRSETVPSSSGMPRRAVRRRGSAGIQIQVRLDDEQIAWLDNKVVEFNAPSRSALVSSAYKLLLARE
jgi:hypothetical protein